VIRLTNGRTAIALHPLRDGAGPTLLCLHEVGGSARDFADVAWPGRVFALDFAGHGASEALRGGSYYPETIAGDADAALAHLGRVHLAGAGVGAYVALLLAGARPASVSAALLLPGAGLAGGGSAPDGTKNGMSEWRGVEPVRRLERDLRPPDYAEAFAQAARRLLFAEIDVQPPWWEAARKAPPAIAAPADRARAFALLAGQPA
jgi:pimeloyl-ACP methyl ester carboxylesterase